MVLGIAGHVLDARIAMAEGAFADAVAALRLGVALQDGLRYDEPASWDFPVRELLAAAHLRAGDAESAERAFRQNLLRHPRSPRSLQGLAQSLRAQGRRIDAGLVEQQFRKIWRGAGPAPDPRGARQAGAARIGKLVTPSM